MEHERFPVHMGWKPNVDPLTLTEYKEIMGLIAAASPGHPKDPVNMRERGLSVHGQLECPGCPF